ncbi:hypothetical protein [Actinotalea sp.]|uniref:hypothetical protein n=1 Tax=Actinotalea sp. TaxID=1872145 RepID=UPI0035670C8B
MTLLSILDRFRPAGAPGSAGAVGVPAVDESGPAAELAPVFAALRPAVDSARDRVARARLAAAEEVDGAREQASAVTARARLEADAARTRAANEVSARAAAADADVREAARREAERLAVTGRRRIAALAPHLAAALVDGTPQDES